MADDDLLAEMKMLRDRVVGVTDTVLASRDGLVITADTATIDQDNLAALGAAMLGVAQRMAAEAGQSSLQDTVARSAGGYVATCAVGSGALLVIIGDAGLNWALLYRESRSTVSNLGRLLAGASPRADGTPAVAS
jgi:uncharacterized protein